MRPDRISALTCAAVVVAWLALLAVRSCRDFERAHVADHKAVGEELLARVDPGARKVAACLRAEQTLGRALTLAEIDAVCAAIQ